MPSAPSVRRVQAGLALAALGAFVSPSARAQDTQFAALFPPDAVASVLADTARGARPASAYTPTSLGLAAAESAPAGAVAAAPEAVADPAAEPAGAPAIAPAVRGLAAPVRMDLVQRTRRVALVAGVSQQAAPAAPTPIAAPEAGARIVYSRASVVVDEAGRRTVVYSERSAPVVDLGRAGACGVGALQNGALVRGLRRSPLRRGMRGDAVLAAQQMLCAAGYAVSLDGDFGRETATAVRAFQSDHNETAPQGQRLAVSGSVNLGTWEALESRVQGRIED